MTTPAPHLAAVPAPAPRLETAYIPAPEGAPADAPRVFAVVAAVMAAAMPVGKDQRNEQQNYNFRGIDDVMSAMAGPMRAHGLFILPSIVEHRQQRDGKMTRTVITMRYRIYGPAGDCLLADVPGEAFDYADKATNKAQSAALKYLLFTLFMLPVDSRSIDDGDRHHPEPPAEHRAEQAQRQQRQQRRGGQRGQQRQQGEGGQQPRRSNRAEPGPWEQQPQQAGPNRDYLTDAHRARTPEEFAKVRAAAEKAGAPADYLARLDTIAAQKREAAQQGGQQRGQQAPPKGEQQGAAPAPPASVDRAAALAAMYAAATDAGVTDRGEADELFTSRHGVKPGEATLEQLREMRADLLDAAQGAAA
ncbi:ERF family protein [Streptomyces sp. BB1-1-1]|uniref:ERF family protein n=1 Tax=Streptomyces sp. BB1-1-1 TaxID=3074430 RepID=UPI0028776959|nr:ERF family protein [Streptomyces sp. BB1-1-1]WND36955.1 ERF family protein [Streptomyces sp. BB1-1-1]